MEKKSLKELMTTIDYSIKQGGLRNGIPIDKGIVLTETKILKNRALYEKYCSFFTAYPDLYLDLIKPADSNFQLFFYQRIFLRACLRYRKIYVCAPRAFSKTFISILALLLKCIFQPGEIIAHKIFELLESLKVNYATT